LIVLKRIFIDNRKKSDHPNKQEVEAILSPFGIRFILKKNGVSKGHNQRD